jgi:hypothetical protein
LRTIKITIINKHKVYIILLRIFRDRINWSCDGSLANQMPWFLFMLTHFGYKTSRFILRGNLEWISLIV